MNSTNTPDSNVVIIDYGLGNLFSIKRACEIVGLSTTVTSSKNDIAKAKAIILPGVGSFDPAMKNLIKQDLVDSIKNLTFSGTPLLGICLGMQLLMENSEEGSLNGIGLINGTAKMIESNEEDIKIPHMGWNNIEINDNNNSRILNGIKNNDYFYFVHSYKCIPTNNSEVAAFTKYGQKICAVIEKNNVFATQFHPEKSGIVGLKIYQNFLSFIEIGK